MAIGSALSVGLIGLKAFIVQIQAFVSPGLPYFSIIGLPYLFTSVDAVHNAMNGAFGEEMSSRLQDQLGIVNLGWCDVGFRNITNSKKPEDPYHDQRSARRLLPVSWRSAHPDGLQRALHRYAAGHGRRSGEPHRYDLEQQHL